MSKGMESEPSSCLRPPVFMIGQDSRGNWVVRDQSGLRGGLFIGRAEALRYVHFESGSRASAVVVINGAIELDTIGMKQSLAPNRLSASEGDARRVA